MNYDSEAIRKAYPNAVVIHDDVGVFEQTGTDENDDAILKEIIIDQTLVDAAGYSFDFVIGGTSDELVEDFFGPQIRLFMNDTLFNYRDYTSDNPDFEDITANVNFQSSTQNSVTLDFEFLFFSRKRSYACKL